jgi:hypothetical protein
MKNFITLFLFIFGTITTMNAQIEKTLIKRVDLQQTHTAYVMLPGDVAVTEWDEDYLRVTTTIEVENMNENIVKRLVIVGRYTIETQIDKYGKMYILQMPNVAHFVTVKGVDLVETYKFEVIAPKGYKLVVKEELNPNFKESANTKLGQVL